jgi:hypothetical protein
MEKTVKITWPEILKWFTFIALLISSFVVSQLDISYLKKENRDRIEEIKGIKQEQKVQGEAVANMNGKLSEIQCDVKVIKNAVLNIENYD